jgi:hypothetical protein
MHRQVTPLEARAALDTIERRRLDVVGEIDLPRWYWWGLALCWIGLGLVADLAHVWVTAGATFAFGTIHAAVAPRVMSGRHRSRDLSVRADVAGRAVPWLVIGGLILLTIVTVAVALVTTADGARHPATIASVFVAVVIVLGGPQLLGAVRRKASEPPVSS